MRSKKPILYVIIIALVALIGIYVKHKYFDPKQQIINAQAEVNHLVKNEDLRNGDLIFQTSLSAQSQAIQLATNSKYSHCGIIYKNGKEFFVFEAIQPVSMTPLSKWIAKGDNGEYVIKRLKNADTILTSEIQNRMKSVGQEFIGKNYDLTFEWSDDRIYCSELIWKIYKRATGIEIGNLEKLSDFDLSHQAVKDKMKERYGDNIPMDEIVISPASIFESELLVDVKSYLD